jgi:hypothetical protein
MADMKPCMASVHVDFLLHAMHDPQYIERNLVWVIRNVAAPYLRGDKFQCRTVVQNRALHWCCCDTDIINSNMNKLILFLDSNEAVTQKQKHHQQHVTLFHSLKIDRLFES